MQHFLRFWASYSITWPRCKRSFVSNNWCLVWTGSAFPQSFLSCKQSDAERKDYADIPEQDHGTKPIHVTLHFRDRRGAASPRYRNRTKIILCVNRSPVWYGSV